MVEKFQTAGKLLPLRLFELVFSVIPAVTGHHEVSFVHIWKKGNTIFCHFNVPSSYLLTQLKDGMRTCSVMAFSFFSSESQSLNQPNGKKFPLPSVVRKFGSFSYFSCTSRLKISGSENWLNLLLSRSLK